MRVKDLHDELYIRGLECKACAEKSDVVAMVKASWHVPKIRAKKVWGRGMCRWRS